MARQPRAKVMGMTYRGRDRGIAPIPETRTVKLPPRPPTVRVPNAIRADPWEGALDANHRTRGKT